MTPPVVTSTATCNSDEVVVGGGFIATDNINIRKEGKVDNSWQIEAIGGEAERQGDTLQTLAMCLNFTGD